MKKFAWVVAVLVLFALPGCKSEFEKIRTSGDADSIYKTALDFYDQGEYLKAQTLLELVVGAYRGRKELEEAYFKYAYTFYYLEKFVLASYYFENFANTFPTSLYREEATYMTAFSYFQLSPSFRLDQEYTNKAIDAFQLFVNTYPNSERVEECNRQIDLLRQKLETKAFDAALLYFDLKQYQSATQSFENLLKDFPETANAERVRYLISQSAYLLASNSVVDKQKERFESALNYAKDFERKYPRSDYGRDIKIIIDTSEKKLKSIADGRYQEQGSGDRS
jgi:outer membrane protein assembly factor BamD